MSPHTDPHGHLESTVSHVLRDLPRPRAPASLEQRVLDELQRRRERSWLQLGFSQWPLVTRIAFVVVCVIAMLTLSRVGAAPLELLLSVVPTPWIYATLGVGTLLYAALFGLGATAYRTLYLQPLNRRW